MFKLGSEKKLLELSLLDIKKTVTLVSLPLSSLFEDLGRQIITMITTYNREYQGGKKFITFNLFLIVQSRLFATT